MSRVLWGLECRCFRSLAVAVATVAYLGFPFLMENKCTAVRFRVGGTAVAMGSLAPNLGCYTSVGYAGGVVLARQAFIHGFPLPDVGTG